MRRLLNFGSNTLFGGAIILAITTILSKLIGLARDKLLAYFFGPGVILDSYFASFRLPDFIFNSLVLGVLGAALIPALVAAKEKNKHDLIISNVVFVITIILFVLTIIAWIFCPSIVSNITSGFDNERLQLTVGMTRIMLISVSIFGISNVFGCVLQAKKIFTSVALAGVFYNFGIIIGAFVAYKYGSIYLAWGVVVGALFHLLTQLPNIIKLKIIFRNFSRLSKESIQVFKLMLPRIIGLIGGQLGLTVITAVISLMPLGSLTIYSLAVNIQSVPYAVIGVALAVAAFPFVSEAANYGKNVAQNHLNQLIRIQIILLVPIIIAFWVWRMDIIHVLIGGGNYNTLAVTDTAKVLAILLLAVIPMSFQQLSARTLYALKNTTAPALISICSLLMIMFISWLLKNYGLLAVCSGLVVIDWLNAIAMYWFANRGNQTSFYQNWIYKIAVATILTTGLQVAANYFLSYSINVYFKILMIIVSTLAGLVVYAFALWILGVDELNKIVISCKRSYEN
jgi:putative peptidoglycan lipid II flippase